MSVISSSISYDKIVLLLFKFVYSILVKSNCIQPNLKLVRSLTLSTVPFVGGIANGYCSSVDALILMSVLM